MHNYWVIIERENLTEIKEEQIAIFLQAKQYVNKPQFDKNANLLVLHKVNSVDSVNKDALLQSNAAM